MDKKLIDLVKTDEKLKTIIKELINDSLKTKEEAYKEIIAYLASKDINASKEDLDELLINNKSLIFKTELSETELDTISGGFATGLDTVPTCSNSEEECHYSAGFVLHSDPGCSATVEYESWCGSDDACSIWDVKYKWYPKS